MKRKRNNVSALGDLDMVVDPRPLTGEEKQEICEYIRAQKEERKRLGLDIDWRFVAVNPRPLTKKEKDVLLKLEELENAKPT